MDEWWNVRRALKINVGWAWNLGIFENQILEPLRSWNIMIPLKTPRPTPAETRKKTGRKTHVWSCWQLLCHLCGEAQKLRSIILLQFELISFRFVYMRTLKTLIPMISGLSNVTLSPKTYIIYVWRHQDTPNNPREIQKHVKTSCVLASWHLKT